MHQVLLSAYPFPQLQVNQAISPVSNSKKEDDEFSKIVLEKGTVFLIQ